VETKSSQLLKLYLTHIGISSSITESDDSLGHLMVVNIPKDNPSVGILLGRGGSHLFQLKQVLKVVGFTEKLRICLVIKLI
jgi:hypothetical protein